MNDIENQNQTHTLLLTRKWLYNIKRHRREKDGILWNRMSATETKNGNIRNRSDFPEFAFSWKSFPALWEVLGCFQPKNSFLSQPDIWWDSLVALIIHVSFVQQKQKIYILVLFHRCWPTTKYASFFLYLCHTPLYFSILFRGDANFFQCLRKCVWRNWKFSFILFFASSHPNNMLYGKRNKCMKTTKLFFYQFRIYQHTNNVAIFPEWTFHINKIFGGIVFFLFCLTKWIVWLSL